MCKNVASSNAFKSSLDSFGEKMIQKSSNFQLQLCFVRYHVFLSKFYENILFLRLTKSCPNQGGLVWVTVMVTELIHNH